MMWPSSQKTIRRRIWVNLVALSHARAGRSSIAARGSGRRIQTEEF